MTKQSPAQRQPSHRADSARVLEHFRRGVALLETNDGVGAARELDAVLRVMPDNPDARCLRGVAANQSGDHQRAVRELRRGLRGIGPCGPDTRDAYNEYAIALRSTDELETAESVLRDVLTAQPEFAAAWHNLALVLQGREQFDEGVSAARRATLLEPGNAGMLLLLGKLLRRQGRLLAAVAALRKAHALEPDDPSINTTLGNTLFFLAEIDESIECFGRAAARLPESAIMQTNYGTMLAAVGRYDDALAAHDRALALEPDNPEVIVRRGTTLLNLGRIREGWQAFDGRLVTDPRARRWRGTPEWDGSSLANRTIVAYREQGIGDEIMFASMYRDLIAIADEVVIEADPRVAALFARSFRDAQVCEQVDDGTTPEDDDAPRPVHPTADVAIPAGSIAQYLRGELPDYPRDNAYLYAADDRVAHWRGRLDEAGATGRRVGISWRSMIRTAERRLEYTRLDEWGPILRTAGIDFVLLQYDQCDREVIEAEARFGIRVHRWHDLDLMNDLDEVAALTSGLDLVIAPRNAVMTLSGALGVPTLAIGNVGDWSECGTGQLPWFSTVECINRRVGAGWDPVLAEVAERVRALTCSEDPVRNNEQRKATV